MQTCKVNGCVSFERHPWTIAGRAGRRITGCSLVSRSDCALGLGECHEAGSCLLYNTGRFDLGAQLSTHLSSDLRRKHVCLTCVSLTNKFCDFALGTVASL